MKRTLATRLRGWRAIGLRMIVVLACLPTVAMASPGCANIGSFAGSVQSNSLPGANYTGNFNAGDVLSGQWTRSGGSSAVVTGLYGPGGTPVLISIGLTSPGDVSTGSYTVPSSGSRQFNVHAFDGTGDAGIGYSFTCTSSAPTLTSISPTSGPIGGTVTLTGTGFYGTSAVMFGSFPAAVFTVNSATSITATVPNGAFGGPVTVSVTTDAGTTGTVPFTITTPVANAVSATVNAGSSNNPILLNITGTATSVAVASAPAHGTATASGTTISYTPTAGYGGPDSFTYTATSNVGTSAPATVSLTVTAPPPVVNSVSASTANGSYKAGDVINVTVNFNQAVTVTGTPNLLLQTGSAGVASYQSGSGTSTLGFSYTVQAGDGSSDLDYQSTTALVLNGGSITNAGGTNAVLTLPSPGGAGSLRANKNLVLDTLRPTGIIVVADTSLSAGETTTVTFTFSEAVTGLAPFDLTIGNGVLSGLNSNDGGVTWTATLTPATNVNDPGNVITLDNTGVADAAGNTGTATTNSNNYAVGTVRPTASIVVADGSLAAGETSLVTITFSEAVAGFDNADLTIANGTLGSVSSGDGGVTWTATFTPTNGINAASNLITLDNSGVANASGNPGTGTTDSNNYVIDTAAPTVTAIDTAPAAGNATSVTYAVTFSEAVTGVDTSDFTLASTGTVGAVIASVAATDASHYTVTANGITGDGILRLDLNGSGTGIVDTVGNAAPGFSSGQSYTFDHTAPTVTSVAVPANGRYHAGQSLDFTVNFSEAMTITGTPYIALTLDTGGTVQAQYVSGSGTSALTFRYTVAAGNLDDNGVTVGALSPNGGALRDAAGNDAATTLNNVGNTTGVLVGQQSQTITFGAQAAQTFAPNGSFALSPLASSDSGLPVAYSSQTSGVCSIGGSVVTMLTTGTCTIAADQAGDSNYTAAATVTQSIAIGVATQAITNFAANPAAPAFIPNGTFTVSATGGASTSPVTFASTSPLVCTINGNTVTMLNAGSCALTADQAGDANYSAAPQMTLDVVIGAASQAITFGAQPGQSFVPNGTFALDPVASSDSGLPIAYSSQTAAVCTISGTTVTMLTAGPCTIAADQTGDGNYSAAATVTQSIAIGVATQAITDFAANPAAPVFAPNGTFTVSATGGASTSPVTFASTSPSVCSVSSSTVTMLGAGTCALTADQAGDGNYGAAPQASLTVVIGAAMPTLDWIGDVRRIQGEPAFDLPDPQSDSSGSFSFTSSNPQVATVSGHTVTIVGAGVTTLVATQAAAGNYLQASISTTLSVDERPDPTLDPGVAGGLQAQVDASVRFAAAQQGNIHDRLRQLRSGGNASANNVTMQMGGGSGPGLSLNAGQVVGETPALAKGWGVWTAGTMTLGERDARTGSSGFDFRSDGVTIGVDRLVGEHAVLGIAGGFGWNDTDFDGSTSQLDARQRSLAVYGLWRGGEHLFVDGILGFGKLDFDISRWSEVAAAMATAQRDGRQHFGSLTLGYEHAARRSVITGYGRFDASRSRLDGYRETGLGIYDLRYGDQDVDNSSLAMGIEDRYTFATASAEFHPYWSLEYRQALADNSDVVGINYVVQPRGTDYLLGLRSYGDDALGFGTGLDVAFGSGWNLSLQFRREQSHTVSGNSFGLRISYGTAVPAAVGAMDNTMREPPAH